MRDPWTTRIDPKLPCCPTTTSVTARHVEDLSGYVRLHAPDSLCDDGCCPLGRAVPCPDDILVRTNEDEARLIGFATIAVAVTDNSQRHTQCFCRPFKCRDGQVFGTERKQAETRAKLLEDIAPAG